MQQKFKYCGYYGQRSAPAKKSRSSERDFFIHCEAMAYHQPSGCILSRATSRPCISSHLQVCIENPFAIMIYIAPP